MKQRLTISIVFTVVLSLLFVNIAYAAGNLSLDPATGEITAQGKTIDIVIDSGGAEIEGIELTIEYEGDISFVGFASGDISGCEVDGLERETYDDIFIYCFIMADPYTGDNGVFASLEFIATGEGGAEVTITSAVVGQETVTIGPSGNYTTTILTPDPDPTPPPSTLPNTSLFSTLSLSLGALLIFASFFFLSEISFKKKSLMMKKLSK